MTFANGYQMKNTELATKIWRKILLVELQNNEKWCNVMKE